MPALAGAAGQLTARCADSRQPALGSGDEPADASSGTADERTGLYGCQPRKRCIRARASSQDSASTVQTSLAPGGSSLCAASLVTGKNAWPVPTFQSSKRVAPFPLNATLRLSEWAIVGPAPARVDHRNDRAGFSEIRDERPGAGHRADGWDGFPCTLHVSTLVLRTHYRAASAARSIALFGETRWKSV